MKNITLTCPNCQAKDKAVGDPDERNNGWSGDWFCFNCKSHGTFQMDFRIDTGAEVTDTPAEPTTPQEPVDPNAPVPAEEPEPEEESEAAGEVEANEGAADDETAEPAES